MHNLHAFHHSVEPRCRAIPCSQCRSLVLRFYLHSLCHGCICFLRSVRSLACRIGGGLGCRLRFGRGFSCRLCCSVSHSCRCLGGYSSVLGWFREQFHRGAHHCLTTHGREAYHTVKRAHRFQFVHALAVRLYLVHHVLHQFLFLFFCQCHSRISFLL